MTAIFFIVGGGLYMGLELLWRGRTHWTMGLAGGLCAAALYALFSSAPMPFYAAFVTGAIIITAVEFAVGWVVNIKLGLRVWDYSTVPMNLMGQICLPFSFLWGLLSLAVWGVAGLVG